MSSVLDIEATINQHIAYISLRLPVVSVKFLNLSLAAAYTTLRALSDDSGSTKGALTCEDIKRFKIAVPPVSEQEEIVRTVELETAALTAAITRAEREIALMQEYRTRLTVDVVTGKLDVRAAAAKLPEITADPMEGLEDGLLEESETEEDE